MTMPSSGSGSGLRGFDKEKAVAAAMREFWSRGFEGVSIDDLTAAMGVSRPTLYAVFGGKEALFIRALDHYGREEAAFYGKAVEATTARGVAEVLLRGALELFIGGSTPAGCLFVTHLVARGAEADVVRADLIARVRLGQTALRKRFKRAEREGELGPGVDPVGLAHLLMSLVQGLAVQASAGASRAAMTSMVETALALWPTVEPKRAAVASPPS